MNELYTQDGGPGVAPVIGGLLVLVMIGLLSSLTEGAGVGTTLTGIISDPKEEKFVEGALVALNDGSTGSDAIGYYAFTNLTPGDFTLTISKAGYETKVLQITIVQGANKVDIALSPEVVTGASLTGVVLDFDSGAPIVGATITLDSRETATDGNGAFLFEDLVPATYHFVITLAGYYGHDTYLTLSAGDNTANVLLVALPGVLVTLQGTVVDAVTKYPIEGALVTLDSSGRNADEHGGFAFTTSPGSYILTITAEGYEDYTNLLDLSNDLTIQVGMIILGGQFEVTDLTINPSELYIGQITEISATVANVGDVPGAYIANCVILPPEPGQGSTMQRQVVLNPGQSQTATFTISPNLEGVYQVSVDGLSASLLVKPVVASVVFTVADGATEGPLGGVTVDLGGLAKLTDDEGACEFTNIPEGEYLITFSKEGYWAYVDIVTFYYTGA